MKRELILRDSRGFTLVEIIAVIVLIALIMTVVAGGVFGKSNAAKWKLNMTKMAKLEGLVETYHLQYNHYPSKLEELINEVGAGKGDFEDVFGSNGEQYEYKTENNTRTYTITSLGKDRLPGGEGPDKDLVVGTGAK